MGHELDHVYKFAGIGGLILLSFYYNAPEIESSFLDVGTYSTNGYKRSTGPTKTVRVGENKVFKEMDSLSTKI